jgi:hypothetical protein
MADESDEHSSPIKGSSQPEPVTSINPVSQASDHPQQAELAPITGSVYWKTDCEKKIKLKPYEKTKPSRLYCSAVTRYGFVAELIVEEDPEQKIWRLRGISNKAVGWFLDAHMYMYLLLVSVMLAGVYQRKVLGVVCALGLLLIPVVNIIFLAIISLAMLFYLIAFVVWIINLFLVTEDGPFRSMIKSDDYLQDNGGFINDYVTLTIQELQTSFLQVRNGEQSPWMANYFNIHTISWTDKKVFCVYGSIVESIWRTSVPIAFAIHSVIYAVTVTCMVLITQAVFGGF